ncbi:intracellular growth attenuator family protein [Lewinella sp. JB7]|uniref:intracellular growth attenuator family protein n=1 Tax=Lewinella sp. JB7 TaxID=2962887 RepID=UPI0020CA1535|nr:intracellular growth attenuator family protein [Lewinella sp. JB7]MCP9234995.1 intracellular growth attenuator family protein [Lewinella sp. JB7]
MLKHATTLTVIGFLLFFFGLVSVLLNLVGVDIFFMSWIYGLGVAFSFGLRLLMIVVGLILIYLGQTDWEREEI